MIYNSSDFCFERVGLLSEHQAKLNKQIARDRQKQQPCEVTGTQHWSGVAGHADDDGKLIRAYGTQKKLSEARQPAAILAGSVGSMAEVLVEGPPPFYSYSGHFCGINNNIYWK